MLKLAYHELKVPGVDHLCSSATEVSLVNAAMDPSEKSRRRLEPGDALKTYMHSIFQDLLAAHFLTSLSDITIPKLAAFVSGALTPL
jgi:hypothetical protein